VNCVLAAGRPGGEERLATCLVPANERAEVNGIARHQLDVPKAPFLGQVDAVERTGMAHGRSTPNASGFEILLAASIRTFFAFCIVER